MHWDMTYNGPRTMKVVNGHCVNVFNYLVWPQGGRSNQYWANKAANEKLATLQR
jgi:hypothetical protein